MNFALFLLLNAVLLLRPDDLFPELAGLRLYLLVIVPCLLLSLPRLIELLSLESLRRRPLCVCVLLYFAATLVSLCVQGRISEALFDHGPEFGKVVLYYILLVAVVDTPGRFRVFIAVLIGIITVLCGIALGNHYGTIHIPAIVPCPQSMIDPATGEHYVIMRLVAHGLFSDPNDMCLILGLGFLSCVYCASTSGLGVAGWLVWLLPTPLFVVTLLETHSRGGILGILAGGAGYIFSRFGGPKSLPFAIGGAAAVLALLGGRQGDMSGGGTAHQRVMLWAEGFTWLARHPFFVPTGLGKGWFQDETGHVAHNSFVQAYVETGAFGGGAFLGMFFLALVMLYRLGRGIDAPVWAVQFRHFAFAVVVGWAMGLYSLTRCEVVPTYLAIGIASVLLDRAAPRLPERFTVNGQWFKRGLIFSACGLLFMKVATQFLGKAGI
jgi:hypothetical protein